MTFEEWWKENNCHSDDPVWLVAQHCWEYQQKRKDMALRLIHSIDPTRPDQVDAVLGDVIKLLED